MTHRPTPAAPGPEPRCATCDRPLYRRRLSPEGPLVWQHHAGRGPIKAQREALEAVRHALGSQRVAARDLGITVRALKRRLKAARRRLDVERTRDAWELDLQDPPAA